MKRRETKQANIPIAHCVYCGSHDLGIGWQQNEAIVTFRRNGFLGNQLKHVICRNCGAVEVSSGGIIPKRLTFDYDLTNESVKLF